MAYFEVDITPDGTNNASLVDSDDWMIPDLGNIDVFVWNGSNAPVDVNIVLSHTSMVLRKDPTHYDEIQSEEHYRSVEEGVAPGNIPALTIHGLAPNSFFPFVISNGSGSTQRWLDEDSSTMQIRGHADNIFNGQRVYVIGHHA